MLSVRPCLLFNSNTIDQVLIIHIEGVDKTTLYNFITSQLFECCF